jgi:hypothetical protein
MLHVFIIIIVDFFQNYLFSKIFKNLYFKTEKKLLFRIACMDLLIKCAYVSICGPILFYSFLLYGIPMPHSRGPVGRLKISHNFVAHKHIGLCTRISRP